ncbi:MAG TPA: hypothetical protein VHX44_03735 [Planctomycetota bacterium]|nr:hypothetical protein [Planctomycetota bacterium]
MSTIGALDFQPVPLRTGVWKAEVTGMTYTIFKSVSGYVVHCGRRDHGGSGDTPVGGTPRGLHASYAVAVDACNAHYRSLMK